jgi:hypothetical protein
MDAEKALIILSALANGVDPNTGEIFDVNGPYQTADVIRALYFGVSAVKALVPRPKRAKNSSPRAGVPWTDAEDQQLLTHFNEGLDLAAIAVRHGRTVAGVQARLERQGHLPAQTKGWRNEINPASAITPRNPPQQNATPTG